MQGKRAADSTPPMFEVGVMVDSNGRIETFGSGHLDAAQAEHIAARLLALAESTREEARRAFF